LIELIALTLVFLRSRSRARGRSQGFVSATSEDGKESAVAAVAEGARRGIFVNNVILIIYTVHLQNDQSCPLI